MKPLSSPFSTAPFGIPFSSHSRLFHSIHSISIAFSVPFHIVHSVHSNPFPFSPFHSLPFHFLFQSIPFHAFHDSAPFTSTAFHSIFIHLHCIPFRFIHWLRSFDSHSIRIIIAIHYIQYILFFFIFHFVPIHSNSIPFNFHFRHCAFHSDKIIFQICSFKD